MTKLTPAQQRLIDTCHEHRTLIVGGLDETPGINRGVVRRLHSLGLIKWQAPSSIYEESEWVLTDAGKAAVSSEAQSTQKGKE
jgi:hypothetical protein